MEYAPSIESESGASNPALRVCITGTILSQIRNCN